MMLATIVPAVPWAVAPMGALLGMLLGALPWSYIPLGRFAHRYALDVELGTFVCTGPMTIFGSDASALIARQVVSTPDGDMAHLALADGRALTLQINATVDTVEMDPLLEQFDDNRITGVVHDDVWRGVAEIVRTLIDAHPNYVQLSGDFSDSAQKASRLGLLAKTSFGRRVRLTDAGIVWASVALAESSLDEEDSDSSSLLVTATDLEDEHLRSMLQQHALRCEIWTSQTNSYTRYWMQNGTILDHVRSAMGSGGRGGSTLTVADAVRETTAPNIIAVGIAFGMDESKHPIGTVLVSEMLTSYELARVGTFGDGSLTLSHRGAKNEASARLLSLIRAQDWSMEAFGLALGEVLSGEKLIDNPAFKSLLQAHFPNAIGGEMEGSGVQAAAGRVNRDWLVIKGVCDYAQMKSVDKEERQRLAAMNACRVVERLLVSGHL